MRQEQQNQVEFKKRTRIWKILAGFIAVLIYSLFFVFIAFGQDKTQDEPDNLTAAPGTIFSTLLTNMGAASPDSFTSKDIFGAANAGQNLYLFTYKKISIDPEKNALSETAQAFGLNAREAYEVRQGSPSPFLNQDKSVKFSQAQAISRVAEFNRQFQERFNHLQFESRLLNENSVSEIFYNGSIADSGFDLVYDLQVIEQILFNESSDVRIAGEYTGGIQPQKTSEYGPPKDLSPATGFDKKQFGLNSSNEDGEKEEKGENDLFDANNSFSNNSAANTASNENAETNFAFNKKLPKSSEGDLLDPSYCVTDHGLANALKTAPASSSAPTNFISSTAIDSDSNEIDSFNSENENEGNFGSISSPLVVSIPTPDEEKSLADLEKDFESFEEYYESLEPAQEKIEKKESDGPLCYGPICFEVNFRYKEAGLYSPGETCIACEVGKINDHLLKTVKNNLSPSKAPGNIFESAKCKKSLVTSVAMNVIVLFNPVQGPPTGDLITSKDITERWQDFQKRNKPDFWIDHSNKTPESPSDTDEKDITEEAIKHAKANLPEGITQIDLDNEVNKRVNKILSDIAREVEEFELQTSAGEYSEFYQLLEYEINKMNTYFRSYKTTFEALSNSTCPKIKNKSNVK